MPVPVLSVEGGSVIEDGYVMFTIRLSEAATDAVSVDYNTLGGSALRTTDFDSHRTATASYPLGGTVTFAVGEVAK